MKEFRIEDNPYRYLYVDITLKCNMNCNICCSAEKRDSDMTIEYFEEVCKRLKKKVVFRIIGGEPTLHPDFFEFIRVANRYRHHITICTNGKTLSDYEYAKTLKNLDVDFPKKLGDPFIMIMDMSGGLTNDDFYEEIQGKKCALMKTTALLNMLDLDYKRIAITAIIVRGLNEVVIPELLMLGEKHKAVRAVHFRNMAKVGRWVDTEPYELDELKDLLKQHMGDEAVDNPYKILKGVTAPKGMKCHNCCYQFQKDLYTQVCLIEFATERSAKCWYRGQLLNDNFKIVPMFENMRIGFEWK